MNKPVTAEFLFVIIVVALAFTAYTLPWVVNPGTGLSLGANDLAEWASLHPQERANSPAMLTSLLLRLPPAFLVLILGFSTPPYPFRAIGWWVGIGIAGLLILTILPPVEVLTVARNDPNYHQQLMLAGIAIAGTLIGLTGRLSEVRRILAVLSAVMCAIVSIWGLHRGYTLMTGFDLSVRVGLGAIGFIALMILVVLLGTIKQGRITMRFSAL